MNTPPREHSGRLHRGGRVSPKGQVTVPKSVRDHLGIEPGSAVEFALIAGGEVVIRKRPDSARPLRGLLRRYAGARPVSTEEMDEAISQEQERLDARSREKGQ